MLISKNDDEIIPTDADACYEKVASQEEMYLEEKEEERRAILISDNSSQSECIDERLE